MKNIPFIATCALCLMTFVPSPSQAHFGMLIPSANQVDQAQPAVDVMLSFSHPFENIGMELEWPKAVLVFNGEEKQDLKGSMSETTFMDHMAWKFNYKPQRPGVYWFAMEPAPYWEPAEDLFIIHYTKTVLAAFGEDQGWDTAIGLKTEIVPLLRPFGNYAGNTFTGRVLLDGNPVADTEVEVEHYNQEKWVPASDAHITQVIKTDDNGVFSFTCPLPGWWGFAALNEADYTLKGPDDKDKQVEIGAVIWVYFDPNPFTGQ